ncbi:MAG TPA: YggT family protein [Candidatus Saccharimonadales bacterium]|nr:YggT family protein [Candidatus Saccharimonadales bacterium]
MTTHVQHVKHIGNNGHMTARTTRVDDADIYAARNDVRPASMAAHVIWYVASVLLALLAIRFVLALLGANPANQFANFIYSVSHPFVAPFFSLFNYNLQYGASHFETFTLVAMLVYALIAGGIARLVTIKRDAEADSYVE